MYISYRGCGIVETETGGEEVTRTESRMESVSKCTFIGSLIQVLLLVRFKITYIRREIGVEGEKFFFFFKVDFTRLKFRIS